MIQIKKNESKRCVKMLNSFDQVMLKAQKSESGLVSKNWNGYKRKKRRVNGSGYIMMDPLVSKSGYYSYVPTM